MNVERLHAIAKAVQADIRETAATKTLQELTSALQNQVNQPQQADHQRQVVDHLKRLTDALSKAPSNRFPPTWKQLLQELGIAHLFGSALAEQIQTIFARNQITPSVALEEIQKLHDQLTKFQSAIEQILKGFGQLNIGAEDLSPGEAEVGVLIPRDFVDNQLDTFGKELDELDEIFGVFAEIATGSRPGFTIRSISSTDLSVFVDAATPTAAFLAVAVERVVALYKKLLEIRKLKAELQDQGIPEGKLKGVQDYVNDFMKKGIEEAVDSLIKDFYKGHDSGRLNELKVGLRVSMRKLANRIDRGFNVEVRIEPEQAAETDEEGAADRRYVEMIENAAPTLQFLKREGRPILSLPEKSERESGEEN